MIVALPCHFGKISLSCVLFLSAAHLGLYAADDSLLASVVSSIAGLLDAVLDLDSSQELSLLLNLISTSLELLAERTDSACINLLSSSVRMQVLVRHIVLHPVDVEGSRLGTSATIHRSSTVISLFLINCFDHFIFSVRLIS